MLIGVTGVARAGKDTVAERLVENWDFIQYAFAEPIKNMLSAMGLRDYELYGGEIREQPLERLGFDKSPRYIMQTLGTEWGRELIDKDIWLKVAMAKWEHYKGEDKCMVVSDVRFPNEADWIREEGTLIHVHRPGVTPVEPHTSEAGIEPVKADLVISNCDSIEYLNGLVDSSIEWLQK
jgi:hypothetical protein